MVTISNIVWAFRAARVPRNLNPHPLVEAVQELRNNSVRLRPKAHVYSTARGAGHLTRTVLPPSLVVSLFQNLWSLNSMTDWNALGARENLIKYPQTSVVYREPSPLVSHNRDAGNLHQSLLITHQFASHLHQRASILERSFDGVLGIENLVKSQPGPRLGSPPRRTGSRSTRARSGHELSGQASAPAAGNPADLLTGMAFAFAASSLR